MYYENYEDYMRSVLGYPTQSQNIYESYNYSSMPYENSNMYTINTNYNRETLDLYPEIYKIVNPMVCKICDLNTKPITREVLDQMTQEIYSNLESQPEFDTIINVRVNTQGSMEKNDRVTQNISSNSNLKSKTDGTYKAEEKDNRQKIEDRQRRPINNTLRDLIRILILNRLLGGNFPNRPPRPRPPYPGPGGNPRPPYLRENGFYDNYFEF